MRQPGEKALKETDSKGERRPDSVQISFQIAEKFYYESVI
jgi:hypothetical protein